MRSMVTSRQLNALRRQVGGDVEAMMAVAGTDVAAVESLAAALLASFQVSGAPDELPEVVLDAVEAPGDTRSAGLLAAMAVLAHPEVADLARSRLERLHRVGVRSPLEDRVGALRAVEAQMVEGEGFEVLLVLLRRRGQRHHQLAMLVVDHDEHAGAAVEGFLTPPIGVRSIAAAVREATGRGGATMPPGVKVEPGELAERLASALARTAAEGVVVSVELATVIPVLSLALCGDPAAFSAVLVDAGHVLDLEVGDDEEFEGLLEEVAGHFVEAAGSDPAVEGAGDLVACTMLDWKWRTGDGELGWWTCSDLEAFLFDYFCDSVPTVDVPIWDVPDCVAAFLCFLDDHDALEGDPLEELVSFVADGAASFVEAATDPAGWGLLKTLVMGLWEAGVDPEDPAAVAAWMGRLGSDTGWAPHAQPVPGPSRARPAASDRVHKSRAKRKAARAARRPHRG
jgi:hypothetical protein